MICYQIKKLNLNFQRKLKNQVSLIWILTA